MRPRTIPACAALVLAAAKLFVIETERTSYVLGVNEQNEVQLVYCGARLARDADFEPAHTREACAFESGEGLSEIEYPGWGGLRFSEPCLKVSFADGVRDLVLKYVSHEIQGDRLVLRLKDIGYDLSVDLPTASSRARTSSRRTRPSATARPDPSSSRARPPASSTCPSACRTTARTA